MPPTFILILAGIIALSLVGVAVDLSTRRGRRRNIEHDRAAQYASEEAPVPGLEDVARVEGWLGPVEDPDLAPGLPSGGALPEGHPLAGLVSPDELLARTRAIKVSGYAANLTARLHSALSPNKRIKGRYRYLDTEVVSSRPDYVPEPRPRLLHCYRVLGDGLRAVVGNCSLTLGINDMGTAYGGPMPDLGYISSAFCAVSLPFAVAGRVQIAPEEKTAFGRGPKSGFAELDDRYCTTAQGPTGLGAKMLERMQLFVPDQPAPLGQALASFIAGRDNWAFTVDGGLLVCATLEPLQSGEDARQLLNAARHAAELVGK